MGDLVVAAHQPVFLPYLGVVSKALKSDVLVVLDDVQYVRRGFMNRNRILRADGPHWLTVPVQKADRDVQLIDVAVSYDHPWVPAMFESVRHTYGKAPFYDEAMEVLSPLTHRTDWLRNLNTMLLLKVLRYYGWQGSMVFSSRFPAVEDPTERLLDRTRRVGGSVYLSGPNGKEYMSEVEGDVRVEFHDYACVEYPQVTNGGDFVPFMSVLDYMMNVGDSKAAL